ncbi:MAG: response regulator [Treponema sp.]|jgi:AraC-like DNA-binding protein/ActR/RegA family two-component response regulator|nr:response regulator [Treponema sp.]
MLNMLIVDDEPLVLLTIKNLCRWEDFGLHIAGEAANGKAALDFVRANPGLDIVVVDVDMPVMNGIAFAEALQRENLGPVIIFLSSYSNFEYVRSAFKCGACEYMLKSELDEHSLIDIIKRIPEDRFRKGASAPAGSPADSAAQDARSAFFAAVLGDGGGENLDGLFGRSEFAVDWPFYFLVLRPGDLLLVHRRYENNLCDFQKTVADLLRRFAPRSSGDSGTLSYDRYYLFMQSPGELDTAFELFYKAAWTYIDTGFEKKSGGPALDPADFAGQFSQCLAGFLPPSRLVIRSRRYIREHFSDPGLGLADIAQYNGVSKNHLSAEFARETGETISDFLTRTRMRAAEKLLLETSLKIYEIAEKTGYVNVETFTRAFKRVTGQNPSRYV